MTNATNLLSAVGEPQGELAIADQSRPVPETTQPASLWCETCGSEPCSCGCIACGDDVPTSADGYCLTCAPPHAPDCRCEDCYRGPDRLVDENGAEL